MCCSSGEAGGQRGADCRQWHTYCAMYAAIMTREINAMAKRRKRGEEVGGWGWDEAGISGNCGGVVRRRA